MNLPYRSLLPCALAALLAGCGGGVSIGFFDDDFDHEEPFLEFRPFPSGRAGSVTVTAASDAALNGTYGSASTSVSRVLRFSGDPQTCRFRFDGLREPASGRVMAGEIRYLPDTFTVLTSIVAIGFEEFRVDGGTGAVFDRTNARVSFSGATLASVRGNGQSVTLTGDVPLTLEARPSGC